MYSTTRHRPTSQPELSKGNTGMALTTLLICIVNRVGDKMLPFGTPFSCNFSEVQVLSDLTSNRGEDMNVFYTSRWSHRLVLDQNIFPPCVDVLQNLNGYAHLT